MTKKTDFTLEIDSYYSVPEILRLGMKPINNHKMDYLIYEKNSKVYFFEKTNKNLLRLFCVTKRQSFYLS